MATPKQTDPQFKLRLPSEVFEQIKETAAASNRSMNAEIVARLEASFGAAGEGGVPIGIAVLQRQLRDAQDRVAAEQGRLAELRSVFGVIADKLAGPIGEHKADVDRVLSSLGAIGESNPDERS